MSDYKQRALGELVKEPPSLDDPLDVAWLAGLIEGEGYIGISKNRYNDLHGREKKELRVELCIKMADKDVIEKVAKLFGDLNISIVNRTKPHHQDQWKVNPTGYRAIIIMQAIFPYMGKRRQEKIRGILKSYDMSI